MSISLINKIIKGSKQPLQKSYRFPQNKENKKCNGQNQKSGRHRNDHSIEIKSPLKIPTNAVQKEDLTFRNKTESSNQILICQTAPVKFNHTMHTQLNDSFNRRNMKINLQTLQLPNPKIKRYVSDIEAKLIDKLWEICTKLISFDNQYTQVNLSKIQLEIKKMLTLLAQQNLHDQTPLASSKKINLQNCLAHSQCEKQIDHKQFESEYESQNSIKVEIDAQSENLLSIYSGKTIKTESENFESPKISSQATTQDNTKKIEVKKIMYMLQGKSKNNQNLGSKIQPILLSSNKHSYQSLSSFNQNSNDDSGFTVFQIQRCSQRTSQYSKQTQQNQINTEQISKKFYKKGNKQPEISKYCRKRSDTQIHQSISQRSQQLEQSSSIKVGSKRKVLNDIVTMLNHKYNKNIRLE